MGYDTRLSVLTGLHVTATMAAKSGRQGSGNAEKSSPIPHTRIDDEEQLQEIYEITSVLGEGSFGVVRQVRHRETRERLACKAVNKEKVCDSGMLVDLQWYYGIDIYIYMCHIYC